METLYTGADWLTMPFYAMVIFFIGRRIQTANEESNPLYKYYTRGLMAKLVSGFIVCLIYIFYYGGGDTIGYFESSRLMTRMLFVDQDVYFSVLAGNLTIDNLNVYYTNDLCCPDYYKDPQSFTVVRFASPFVLLSGFNFFATTFLFGWISYAGIWRMFLVFNEVFPGMEKKLATAILFMPSVMFWGSAILKDTITFSALCWFTVAIYRLLIKPDRMVFHLIALIVASYLILSIKPYIFVAILPGATIWTVYNRIRAVGNPVIRVMIAPAIMVVGGLLSFFLLNSLSSSLGDYGSVDKALNKAVVTKNDLTRDAYGQNSFDIGEIDGSVTGLIGKFPVAVVAGLFRPFLWEVNNPVMLMSALENAFLLFMFIRIFLKTGPGFFTRVMSHPVLMFCLIFSVLFSFALGLTTANFGALVRYKIPAIPFFMMMIYILEAERDRLVPEPPPNPMFENESSPEAHEVVAP